MKGQSNFLPCFGVIQDELRLIRMGPNFVTIQVFDLALILAHPSGIENRNVVFF